MTDEAPTTEQELIRRRVHELGPWFYNMNLGEVWTAPEHFLGDYPNVKWQRFAHAIPADLRGRSVLDVGCNAGFYALEMRRRGADRVVAVDADPGYLAQARFAAEVEGPRSSSASFPCTRWASSASASTSSCSWGVLPPAPPAPGARPDPRARRPRPPRVPVDATRQRRGRAGGRGLLVLRARPVRSATPRCTSSSTAARATPPTGGCRTRPASRRCCAAPASTSSSRRRRSSSSAGGARRLSGPTGRTRCSAGSEGVIEAVMLWNEPNNKSHWAFEEDPDWTAFAEMTILASRRRRGEPGPRARAGRHLPDRPLVHPEHGRQGCPGRARRGRGAWLPARLEPLADPRVARAAEIQAVTDLPVWVSEVGISTFGAEEVQVFGLKRTAELLIGRAGSIGTASATCRGSGRRPRAHKEAEGSSYCRHFYMGLLREDGSPKLALPHFSSSRRSSASASGSISRTTGFRTPSGGCASLGCATSAPA